MINLSVEKLRRNSPEKHLFQKGEDKMTEEPSTPGPGPDPGPELRLRYRFG